MGLVIVTPPRRWKNVGVVGQRDEHRVRRLWTWLLGAVVALVPATAYLVQQMEHVRTQYAIESARARLEALAEKERRLRIERSSLESLPRVEQLALRDLGLERPAGVVVVPRPGAAPGQLLAGDHRPPER